MVQEENTSVSDIAGSAIIQKRQSKANRGFGNYTGNLVVFSQRQLEKGTIVQENRRNVEFAAANAAAELKLDNSASGSNDSVSERAGTSRPLAWRSSLSWRSLSVITILVAIATGAVIGNFTSTAETDLPLLAAANPLVDSPQPAAQDTTVNQPQQTASLQPQIEHSAASTEAPDASPSNSNVEANVQELDMVSLMAEEYLEEINELQSQNESLQAKAVELDGETVELNKQLLGLEWAITAAELESKPVKETRIVYNVVNVPVGYSAEQSGDTTTPIKQYDERDVVYPDSDEQATDALPFGKLQEDNTDEPVRWDDGGEPVEFIDAYPSE